MINARNIIKRSKGYKTYDNKDSDIAALNELLKPYDIKISDTIESARVIQYKAELNLNSNVNKILKANYSIALNDDNVNVYVSGRYLIIEKSGANNNVRLGDLYNDRFLESKGLTLMLGKDTNGHNLYTDLSKAPHMLVAGCTGSGKSIFLHSCITSLLMKNENIELYLADPKGGSEFGFYSGIESVHTLTTFNATIGALKYLCEEVDNRYRVFAANGVRDIESANAKGLNYSPIVFVCDEFADLMETAKLNKVNIEQYVVKIAQKARACGVHLIIATQYPVVKYVTGAIKANIPVRVALKVNSITESRVMLDHKGAEKLIGHGDMLFLGNGAFEPLRIQGCYVEESEIKDLVNLCIKTKPTSSPYDGLKEYKVEPKQERPAWKSTGTDWLIGAIVVGMVIILALIL